MGRKVQFNDEKRMKQKSGGSNVVRFKAQVGVKDVVRLMDPEPLVTRSHYDEALGRGFTCSKEWDEAKGAYGGPCPLCEEGNRAQERFAVKIIHIARDREAVKKYRLWQFGLDKYQILSDIQDETDKPLNEQDLVIKCTDEKYQKLNILPSAKCRTVTADVDSDFELDAVMAVPTYEKLQGQLAEARGGSSSASSPSSGVDSEDIDDDDDLGEPSEKPGGGKPAAASKPATAGKPAAGKPATAKPAAAGKEPVPVAAGADDDDDYDIDDLLGDDDK